MPNFTTNLNLEKPLGTEYYDIEVHNENSDKIDTFAGEVLKKTGDTADDLAVIAPPIDVLDVARKQELNSMAGADIKGYIEDGGLHLVGEIWLSRNVIGEFRCLIENSDITIIGEKWLQIDDNTNAKKLENLMAYPILTPINVHSSIAGLTIRKIHTNLVLINGAIGSDSSQLVIPASQKLFELPIGYAFVNESRVPVNSMTTQTSKLFSMYAAAGTSFISNSSASSATLMMTGYFSFVAVISY